MTSIVLLVTALAALAASYGRDRDRTRKALRAGCRSFVALIPNLLAMTALVGLTLSLVPPQRVASLFALHGLAGFGLISIVGALITMPAPVAFPLAGSLLRVGVSLPALAAFITTLTMVGTVTAPLEIEYFGRRFTLVRQGLSFALAVLVGASMGGILR